MIGHILFYLLPFVWGSIFFLIQLKYFPLLKQESEEKILLNYWVGRMTSLSVVAISFHFLTYYSLFYLSNFILTFILIFSLLIFTYYLKNSQDRNIWIIIAKFEVLIFLVYGLFLISFGFHAHLIHGEKGPDFQLLSYLFRYNYGPIENPVASGLPMHYYYLGMYLVSVLGKFSFLKADSTYFSGLSLFASYLFASVCIFFLQWKINYKKAIIYSLAILIAVNFSVIINYAKGISDYSLYWQSTRTYPHIYFAEYPFFTYTFADLHPHLISLPFSVALLAMIFSQGTVNWFSKRLWFIYSFIFATNIWDFFVLGILAFIILFSDIVLKRTLVSLTRIKSYSMISNLICLGLISPFIYLFLTRPKNIFLEKLIGFKINASPPFYGAFLHQGHWWILTLLFLPWSAFRKIERPLSDKKSRLIIFLCFSIGLFIFSEYFIFLDQMNTIFKIRTWTFLLFYLSFIICLEWNENYHSIIFKKIGYVILGFFVLFSIPAFRALLTLNIGPVFTLDGLGFLESQSKNVAQVVNYANEKVVGIPSVVEAPGDSFNGSHNIFSLYSGLPTYLGWRYHAMMRGLKETERQKREAEINFIFEEKDALKVYEFLSANGQGLVVVGPVEKGRYSKGGLSKFEQFGELFTPLIKTPEMNLYGVKGMFELRN